MSMEKFRRLTTSGVSGEGDPGHGQLAHAISRLLATMSNAELEGLAAEYPEHAERVRLELQKRGGLASSQETIP